MKCDLPDELTVDADGPVLTVTLNRYLSQVLGGPPQPGFAAERVMMQTEEHRQRLLELQTKSKRT